MEDSEVLFVEDCSAILGLWEAVQDVAALGKHVQWIKLFCWRRILPPDKYIMRVDNLCH